MDLFPELDGKGKMRLLVGWLASTILSATAGAVLAHFFVFPLEEREMEKRSHTKVEQMADNNIVKTFAINVNSEIIKAVEKVKPAVVTVVRLQDEPGLFTLNRSQETGKGSGVLIDRNGHIVTNNHVVEGASEVQVVIGTEQIKARVLGTDPLTDLAVLEVPLERIGDIEPVTIGKSESLQTGEPAIAIGNPLGEFEQTVTVGVISAKNRNMPLQDQNGNVIYEQTVLQTDAAINPGNSGGALINIQGQLIGINSAKIALSGVEGLGFAIPVDEAMPVIDQLMNKGRVVRPALGVTILANVSDISENDRAGLPIEYGVIVDSAAGQAEKAGIQRGDIIVKMDGTQINSYLDLRKYLFKKKPGDSVQVTFYRDSKEKTVTVILQELGEAR